MKLSLNFILYLQFSTFLLSAERPLKLKALHGHIESQLRLGFSHVNMTPANWSEAIFWFGMAADREDAKACNWLGFAYENGLGTIKNYERAIYYYQRGASLGSMECAKSLAVLFDKNKNYVEANAWKIIYKENSNRIKSHPGLSRIKKLSVRDLEFAIELASEIQKSWNVKTVSPILDPLTEPPRFGSIQLRNGSDYTGILLKEQPEGYGSIRSGSGETYYGYFKNGQKNGYGTAIGSDGKIVFEGTWINGVPSKPDI